MNARLALLLCACSTACAELPPVVDKGGGVTPTTALNVAKPPPSLTSDYEMMKRIDQMQAEVQQLTGKVEEQAFQIEELKKQQKTMYTDFDDRLQSLENKSGASQPSSEVPADTSGSVDPGSSGSESPAPAAVDQPTGAEQPQDKSSGAAAPALAASAQSSDTGPTQVSDAEKQEYQQAYDDLRNGRTAQAITEFNAYIANHPDSGYASNSQYWLGEAHRVNQDNASARKAFNDVVANYPNSAKVPDALLKLGYIEMEEKNPAEAREYLTRVTTEFANSRAAALAQKKLLVLDGSSQ
ncbi:tol-pal system protein YbgF [Methyloglobulus sp.]|uniref:tol-pal system protein YbgF n=1 Tax=Methyloglobulus sp. TaxID=2518622 RepID=UPI0032B71A88